MGVGNQELTRVPQETADGGIHVIPAHCPTVIWSGGRDVVDGRGKGRFNMRSVDVVMKWQPV